ncbi:MAG: oligosaccharide flippase family protein [Cytophagales bacterium]
MNKRITKETFIYILGTLAILAIGFVLKYLQTNGLSTEDFGNYTFISSFIGFTVLFFQMGFIPSLKLIISNESPESQKKTLGIGFIITMVLGIVFSQFILLSSFFVDDIFNTNVSEIFLLCSPLFFSFLFVHFFNAVGIGKGKPSIGIYFELISRGVFALTLYYFFILGEMSVLKVIILSILSNIFSILLFFLILKPSFQDLKTSWERVKDMQRKFGKDYYLGSITNQSTFKIDDLLISAFVSPVQLGFYALARLLCSPIGLASSALNNALFRDYSKYKRIPGKIFIINAGFGLLGLIIINLISDFIVSEIFGSEYAEVNNYIFLFSLAFLFMALYQPFNFLTAKGKGKVVRNTALVESGVNLSGNFILIPIIGLYGALITTLCARMVHFGMKWYYYRLYLKEISQSNV